MGPKSTYFLISVNKTEGYWSKEYSFRDTYKVDLTMEGVEEIVESLLDPSRSTWSNYLHHMKTTMDGYPSYQRYNEYCAAKYFTQNQHKNCMIKYKDAFVGMEK